MLLSSAIMAAQNIGYRTHILWMNTYERSFMCSEFIILINLAHLLPHLTCIINLRNKPMPLTTTAVPDPLTDPASLTVQLMSQSATTHHHNRPIHHIIHLTFSPSISPWSCLHFLRIWFSFHPLEIAPHRNNNGCTITWATIQPAAVCSFWWFSGRFCSIPMIEFCTTQNE